MRKVDNKKPPLGKLPNSSVVRRSNAVSPNELTEVERIQVIVRVRPMNNTEITRKQKCVLQAEGDQKLVIWNPASFDSITEADYETINPACWSRDFVFDKVLWSMDEEDDNYASQDTVYEVIGQPVLQWTMAGYNSCIFAFGQTGAGKSHTMMGKVKGSARNYGLIPRISFGIFEEREKNSSMNVQSSVDSSGMQDLIDSSDSVTFSHLEIYNENIRDLLAPEKSHLLKIREHPQSGVFVSNLTVVNVNSFEEVMSLIAIGDSNRTVAATNSNTHSSRSHAIVTLTVCQRNLCVPKNGLPTSALQNKIGKVHLVDLAGSERVTLSGAKDTRLKEANHINKSLSVLGDVIKCLGDVQKKQQFLENNSLNSSFNSTASSTTSSSLGIHIPYRNSALTMLLKDSLGGNSHVMMVTAVSPSSSDYEETLSTLKYSDRAKQVCMRVKANVTSGVLASDSSSAAYLVPLLQAEVRKLKEMLRQQQEEHLSQVTLQSTPSYSYLTASGISLLQKPQDSSRTSGALLRKGQNQISGELEKEESKTNTSQMMMEMQKRVKELEKQLLEREKMIDALNNNGKSGGEGLDDSIISLPDKKVAVSSVAANRKIDTSIPRLINLNQDPLFSECLVYYIPEGRTTVGSSPDECDILLTGLDIKKKHCIIYNKKGCIWIEPIGDAVVFVNGEIFLSPDSRKELKKLNDPNKNTDSIHKMLRDSRDNSPDSRENLGYDSSLTAGRLLTDDCRLSFGRYHIFRFEQAVNEASRVDPESNDKSKEKYRGWEFAQEELISKNENLVRLRSSAVLDARALSNLYFNQGGQAGSKYFLQNSTGGSFSPNGINSSSIFDRSAGLNSIDSNSSSPSPVVPHPGSSEYQILRNHYANNKSVRFSQQLENFSDELPPPAPKIEEAKIGQLSGPKRAASPPQVTRNNTSRTLLGEKAQVQPAPQASNANKDNLWDRLQRVADGSETVTNPTELREMLNLLLNKAETPATPPVKTKDKNTLVIETEAPINAAEKTLVMKDSPDVSPELKRYFTSTNKSTVTSAKPVVPEVKSVATTMKSPEPKFPTSEFLKSPTVSKQSDDILSPSSFEKEAKALQQELADMQKTLQERMVRYSSITSSNIPQTSSSHRSFLSNDFESRGSGRLEPRETSYSMNNSKTEMKSADLAKNLDIYRPLGSTGRRFQANIASEARPVGEARWASGTGSSNEYPYNSASRSISTAPIGVVRSNSAVPSRIRSR